MSRYEICAVLAVPPPYPPVYYAFNAMLGLLMILNIYWFYLICGVIYRQIKTGKTEDVRSG